MGGMAESLGGMATDAGTAGVADAAAATGGEAATGGAIDFVSGKAKLAGDWMQENVVDPALNTAKAVDDKVAFGLGQKTVNAIGDIGSQLYKNVSDDISNEIDSVTVRNADGSVNGWKTGTQVGYKLAKGALLASMGGGGSKGQQQDPSQAQAVQAPQAATEAPNADDELKKLKNNVQQF